MKVFLAYGYSRVTMDDIARAAEVSRPALYLVFKNKAEIYRALGSMLLEASAEAGRAALAVDGPFAERMMAAIECSLIAMMKTIRDSPHGAEILDMKNSLAGDLAAVLARCAQPVVRRGDRRRGIAQQGRPCRARLTAAGLADLLLDGLEGMKSRISAADEQREGARRLVAVIALALQR